MTTQQKRDSKWGVAVEKHQCTPFIVGVRVEGFSPKQPPTVCSSAEHLLQWSESQTLPTEWISKLEKTKQNNQRKTTKKHIRAEQG